MNLTNHFLLALPTLHQDYFAATLTYICEHSDDGAMGFVVNRPSDVSVLDFERVEPESKATLGGPSGHRWRPVSTDRGFMLFAGEDTYDSR